jgi:hypothetical protein
MAVFLSNHFALALVVLVMTSACFFPDCRDVHLCPSHHAPQLSQRRYGLRRPQAWHASFLPTETTRYGQQRLCASYTYNFSVLLMDDEAKRVADKLGVLQVIINYILYKQTTDTRRHRRSTLE